MKSSHSIEEYLQILGSGDVGSARTKGHCLFSNKPLYLLLVYAAVRAADTVTVIGIALFLWTSYPLFFAPMRQPVPLATRLPADGDQVATGECSIQLERDIPWELCYFCAHLNTSEEQGVFHSSWYHLILMVGISPNSLSPFSRELIKPYKTQLQTFTRRPISLLLRPMHLGRSLT